MLNCRNFMNLIQKKPFSLCQTSCSVVHRNSEPHGENDRKTATVVQQSSKLNRVHCDLK